MPDSVLMPAPVNALIARAERASSISAKIEGSGSPKAVLSGRVVNPRNPCLEPADHASKSQSVLCPYGRDGTMLSLEQTRIPAQSTRFGAEYPHRREASSPPTGDALAHPM